MFAIVGIFLIAMMILVILNVLKKGESKNRNVKRVRSKIIKKSYLPVELGVGLGTVGFILAGAGGYYLYNKNITEHFKGIENTNKNYKINSIPKGDLIKFNKVLMNIIKERDIIIKGSRALNIMLPDESTARPATGVPVNEVALV